MSMYKLISKRQMPMYKLISIKTSLVSLLGLDKPSPEET